MSQMFKELSIEEAERIELIPALYATEAELTKQTLEDWKKPQDLEEVYPEDKEDNELDTSDELDLEK